MSARRGGRGAGAPRCTVCGGLLSTSDVEDGLTHHAAEPGGDPTCRPAPRMTARSVSLDAETIAFLEGLGPSLSAGVRRAAELLMREAEHDQGCALSGSGSRCNCWLKDVPGRGGR